MEPLERDLRVEREKEAHNERDVLAANARIKARFAHLAAYPSLLRLRARIAAATQGLAGLRVLDYGCGEGEEALRYLANGAAFVDGIDISDVYIARAKRRAEETGADRARCAFHVMDAHALRFEDERFDLVVGHGILHHLETQVALNEIYRVLRPRGRVLLLEPLADNPLLKVFRKLTPHARTVDEMPLSGRQIQDFVSSNDWDADLGFCGILEAPLSMVTSFLLPARPANPVLALGDYFEKALHARRLLLAWNQYVLLDLRKGRP